MPRFPALPLSNHPVVNLFTNHEQNSSSRRCRNAQHSAFFRQRFSNTHTRQFPLGQIPRKRLLLRASAKPLLARALLRVRRAAAANDRAKAGVFAHSPHRALGCRRRMQHTRFGGQQYFGRHRKRYCSAPPFDANQSRFFKRSNGAKAFSQISFRRNRKIRLHRHGAAFNKPRKRIIFTRKTCCRMGQSNPRRPCDLRIGVNVRNFACILKVYPKFLSNCEFQRLSLMIS